MRVLSACSACVRPPALCVWPRRPSAPILQVQGAGSARWRGASGSAPGHRVRAQGWAASGGMAGLPGLRAGVKEEDGVRRSLKTARGLIRDRCYRDQHPCNRGKGWGLTPSPAKTAGGSQPRSKEGSVGGKDLTGYQEPAVLAELAQQGS